MNETDKIIDNINSTMSMENLTLTTEDKERLKECLEGKVSYEDVINNLIDKYKSKD